MNVRRYFESMSTPNDTMFVEIEDRHRFTRRGDDWIKFREDIIQLLEQTVSDELSQEFEAATEDWVSEGAP
ncbi:hypothetical protein F4Y59_09845 [Candidatus Poribacteria bacterium]|nr:hypothetical protein [Candidatus Poribacteria bacterium]MXY28444.1 hypothetical protein [Candidatus Poribacteria bacterium]MYK20579.1 hypothetical protein [Candidatus Poribacteria bacterium]